MDKNRFQLEITTFYQKYGRELPWRTPALKLDENGWLDPYKIVLSEMMLQQTQVSRVIPKYEQFLAELPTLTALSAAPLPLVLELWSGLGYNRRAKYLHDAARELVDMPLPWQPADLAAIKGIGSNTTAAICVYAFNKPHVFIETNIRSVFIHHLQEMRRGQISTQKVEDRDLLPLVGNLLDRGNPREWYWALMDYGSHLKKIVPNPSRASAHHARQSTFAGSRRQLRGQVVRYLLAVRSTSRRKLADVFPDERLDSVVEALIQEGLLAGTSSNLSLAMSDIVLQ
jgi:A/G-specific adenine glycosylase